MPSSKSAFLLSAEAVNSHIGLNRNDKWFCPLPKFHVGGLAIWARCFLAGAVVMEGSLDELCMSSATVTSLVPTQVYDLVKAGQQAPESLRVAIVGGGALSENLYLRARDLGWPLLPSYGMTELASQIATAPVESLLDHEMPSAKILKHVELTCDKDKRLCVKSLSLFTGYVEFSESGHALFARKDNFFITNDRVEIFDGHLKFLARNDDVVKVLGELVNLNQLTHQVVGFLNANNLPPKALVLAMPNQRKENQLVLALAEELKGSRVEIEQYLQNEMTGIECPDEIIFVKEWPETELGKALRAEIASQTLRHLEL